MNLDLDFIDYPTAWAIVNGYNLTHVPACSSAQTGGALLCDCNALPEKWAALKTAHDSSDGLALAAPYMTDAGSNAPADETEPQAGASGDGGGLG